MDTVAVVVGDEILAGHVQDANTHFIAARVALHGHRLRRASIVGDDPARIATEVQAGLDEAGIVFVCGGLGPTHDDRTMEGVSLALGAPLVECEPLARRIEEVITALAGAGVPADAFGGDGMRKMALAPSGAEVLPCSIGVVPAIAVRDSRATVIVLPGPPRELQAVFLEAVEPRFLAGTGDDVWREEITHPFPESAMAAALAELQSSHPATTIGSYPQQTGVLVRIAGPQGDTVAVAEALRARIADLMASVEGQRLLEVLAAYRRARG